MSTKFSLIIASILLALGVLKAEANTSIRNLQRNSGVTISGTVRSVVGNEFILDDGTGEIIVDAGPRWYHQVNLTQGERVTVVGENDDDDFDAHRITRANGEVIKIRDGAGRPPWADAKR